MKNFLALCFLLLVFACQTPAVSEAQKEENFEMVLSQVLEKQKNNIGDRTKFIHTVFIWLNDDVTEEQKADFVENGLKPLTTIPSIYRSYYGTPAGTPRDVVDSSYDYVFISQFSSPEDHDKYQVDPIHKKFLKDYKHLTKKIQVYDDKVGE